MKLILGLFVFLLSIQSVLSKQSEQPKTQPDELHLARRRKITKRTISNGGSKKIVNKVVRKNIKNYIINGNFQAPQIGTIKLTIVESWTNSLNNNLIEIGKGSLYNSRWNSGQVIKIHNRGDSRVRQQINLVKGKYKIVFDHATIQKVSSNRFSVYWNDKLIKLINNQNDEIKHQEFLVDAINGINVLEFRGEEISDDSGHTIDNVAIYRIFYRPGQRVVRKTRRVAATPKRVVRRATRIVQQQQQPEEDYVYLQRRVARRKSKPRYVQIQEPQQVQQQQFEQIEQQVEEPVQTEPQVSTTAVVVTPTPTQQTIQKIVYKKVEVPVQKLVQRIVQVPVQKIVQKVVKKIIQVPVQTIKENITKVPVQKIIQRIVQVQKKVEVPVEKVVLKTIYQPVNKTVQKIIQRIIQVPIDTIVEEKVEVPYQRFVKKIVQKKVQVPVEKQKIIQVPVPIQPVYKKVKVPLKVNVPVCIDVPMLFQIQVQVPDNQQVIISEDFIDNMQRQLGDGSGVAVQIGQDYVPLQQHSVSIKNVTFNSTLRNSRIVRNKLAYRYLDSPDTLTIRRKLNKYGIIKNVRRINATSTTGQNQIYQTLSNLSDATPTVIKLQLNQNNIPSIVNVTRVQDQV